MSRWRELLVVLLLCVLGAGAVFAAGSQEWLDLSVGRAAGLAPLAKSFDGNDAESALVALALVAIAGGLALLATRGWGRVAVGVLLIADGVLILWRSVGYLTGPSQGRAQELLLPDGGHAAGVGVADRIDISAHVVWPVFAVVGGVIVAVAGVIVCLRARRWPAMGARYEAPAARAEEPRGDRQLWDALDRGDDPTS